MGYNAYALRTSDALWSAAGARVRKTGERRLLASTQLHFGLAGRELVIARTAAAEAATAAPLAPRRSSALRPYLETPPPGPAWGMAIDLSACVGCGACVLACQAENNIPVVGKAQVARGREMHWLRVDHYYSGSRDDPQSYFQPVPCMHCENAPCELACPVAATVHDSEGVNQMLYHRCVGTRSCASHCPYKVRRFNFLAHEDDREPGSLQRNPNVTVRSRGVMEKCTYCVQRITAGRLRAEKQGRRLADGDVQTACQAVCPAEAIVFGDINDPRSRVAQLKAQPRSYSLLAEHNTRPRTTYLAAVRNPGETQKKG
jgi:molybdopterin-containing oxidoreductase family iron-sulfur binding subunit